MVCGIISASAMIMPGISGSFILLLLGAYWVVIKSLSGFISVLLSEGFSNEMNTYLAILLSLGIGIIIGILSFAKVMSWALKKYPAVTMYAILGLIIGSIYQIYPGFLFNLRGVFSLFTLVLGIIISLRFGAESKHPT